MHRRDRVLANWQQAQRRVYRLMFTQPDAPTPDWAKRLHRAYVGRGDFTFTESE